MQIVKYYARHNKNLYLGEVKMKGTIDNYKIFESVARNESISRASEELFITQPAVSQAIKRLEDVFGASLFNRTKYGVRLTTEGEILYKNIKQGLDFIENGERLFSAFKNVDVGTIRIGASATLTQHILIPYLKIFHKRYPKIEIEIINHLSSNLVNMLKSGLLDLLILNLPMKEDEELEVTPFTNVQEIICASPDYMDRTKFYNQNELKKYDLITQKLPSNTRTFIDEFFKSKKISLFPKIEVVSFNVVCQLTKIGFGYSMLTKEFVEDDLNNGNLVKLNTDIEFPLREIGLAALKKNSLSFATRKLIDIVLNKD